ncbi:MAG: hypothetical protein AAF719_07735 [Pseudomonadota bacterium]
MNEFWLLGFGALLALLGSVVQALIQRAHSRSERRTELLIDAYSDYLVGIARRASILSAHSERTEEATALMVAGKQKVSAYAPPAVVIALAALEETPMHLSDERTQSAMVELVKAMRVSIRSGSSELDHAIHSVLFSVETIDRS